ncbi:anhydro-N-acetylmuramic acid kinase [Actinosynnema sp. NPDC020468]|uniref:anhydro-N-acetylmuramic acid kinase n=1 Tax=Actinosynnema sp. NPDC020468 TaxID=3154488 RepID=UPI0033DE46E0
MIGVVPGSSADTVDVAVGDLAIEGDVVRLDPVHHARHTTATSDSARAGLLEEVAARHGGELVGWLDRPAPRDRRPTAPAPDPAWIAEATGLTAVADLAVPGGRGLPPTAVVDALWLRDRVPAAALRVGRVASATLVTADDVTAVDLGPGTALTDVAMTVLTGGRRTRDTDGEFAARGRVRADLLARLRADVGRPGSTDHDRAHLDRVAEGLTVQAEDFLATLTAFTADLIADGCAGTRLVVGSGGGLRNPVLTRLLAERIPLRASEEFGLPSAATRPYAAAVLGFLIRRGARVDLPGPRPTTTGGGPPTATVTGLTVGGNRART